MGLDFWRAVVLSFFPLAYCRNTKRAHWPIDAGWAGWRLLVAFYFLKPPQLSVRCCASTVSLNMCLDMKNTRNIKYLKCPDFETNYSVFKVWIQCLRLSNIPLRSLSLSLFLVNFFIIENIVYILSSNQGWTKIDIKNHLIFRSFSLIL